MDANHRRRKQTGFLGFLVSMALLEVAWYTDASQLGAQPHPPCTAPQPGTFALGAVARLDDRSSASFHLDAWLAVSNRRAYSALHDAPVYITKVALSQRHPSWDKLLLGDIALSHSCAEWLWLLDASDAFIMNLTTSILSVIQDATKEWRAAREAAGQPLTDDAAPDIIAANDCNGMNAGSLIVRNTPWARQHLAQAWFTNQPTVPAINDWWEQAALRWIISTNAEVAQHYFIVNQQKINAYPTGGCGDMYQVGDIAVHMPGAFKGNLAFDRGWLNRVPLEALDDGREIVYPHVYEIAHPDDARDAEVAASKVTILFAHGADNYSAPYSVWHESRHTFNPGWPLPEPGMVQHVADAYLAEWHMKTFRSHGLEATGHGGAAQQQQQQQQRKGSRLANG